MNSKYIVQRTEKSHCPKCGRYVWLLCREDRRIDEPWFYICFICEFVAEVGKDECVKSRR